MCGIFGAYSYSYSSPSPMTRAAMVGVLLNGLARLEYRGYDSAGLAVGEGGGIRVVKEQGKVVDLEELCGREGVLVDEHGGDDEDGTASGYRVSSPVSGESVAVVVSGIAHTRWATHGPPSRVNAHPHVSGEDRGFVVVHNGIITNYHVLKRFLGDKGVSFVSDTDTEVVAKMCGWLYEEMTGGGGRVGFEELMGEVLSRLNGSYALLVKSSHYPGELIACKKGSPLILGMKCDDAEPTHGVRTIARRSLSSSLRATGSLPLPATMSLSPTRAAVVSAASYLDDGEVSGDNNASANCCHYYFSSDPAAIIEHTDQALVLEDGDLVHVNNGELVILDVGSAPGCRDAGHHRKNPELIKLDMKVEQIMKGEWDHFMQKEIFEQPDTLLQTMTGRLNLNLSLNDVSVQPDGSYQTSVKLGGLVEHLDSIRRCGRIVIVACGTSYNAGLACRPVLEKLVQVPVSMELASDLLDRPTPIFRNDTCIFMSQSGETADTLRSLAVALQRGALCVGITNTVGSAIARRTHCGVHINAGAEIGVASTKAYTSQIVVLLLLALALSGDSISSQESRRTIIRGLAGVSGAVKKALELDGAIVDLAERLKDEHSLLIFGRGANYATAIEGALKVKEVSLMHSEGILAGEMKHGPLALVDENIPIVVIATQDSLYGKMISVIEQLRARSANLIVICNEEDEEIGRVAGEAVLLRVPSVRSEYVQPIVNIVPLQLLSYHLAIKRPDKVADVDRPPNLAKSVTVLEE